MGRTYQSIHLCFKFKQKDLTGPSNEILTGISHVYIVVSHPWPSLKNAYRYLHECVTYDDTVACDVVLDAGGHINARDIYGWTALHYAAAFDLSEMVQYLLDRQADPRKKNKDGRFSCLAKHSLWLRVRSIEHNSVRSQV